MADGLGKVQLPKDALSRINIGQSFAEYDKVLMQPGVFVKTPAIEAALDPRRSRCFFVGRRGTGKTAITTYVKSIQKAAIQLFPQVFAPLGLEMDLRALQDTRQRPFRSLVQAFKRSIYDEVLGEWVKRHLLSFNEFPQSLARERNLIEDFDFDTRTLHLFEEMLEVLRKNNEKDWLRLIKRPKELEDEMAQLREGPSWDTPVLIDRIDESWDGADRAVYILMALMHSCVEISSATTVIRPLVFLRENIFERVRQSDNEFARLETCVVSLDWSKELLLELIERRMNLPFTTKLALNGVTWDYFFESVEGRSSRSVVLDYCQERPRDVLTYCSFAIESAQSQKHTKIQIEDLQAARRRFSDSRLKDLGDEYQENYHQLQLVLTRFYGLGKEFTVNGIDIFIQKLLADQEVEKYCGSWLHAYTSPELFIHLLYNIGFAGLRNAKGIQFRSLGPRSSTPPPIGADTQIVIHPSYAESLNLQNKVIGVGDIGPLQTSGLLADLPGSIDLNGYQDRLRQLQIDLKTLPLGREKASIFEDVVGEILHLCFFRALTNVEAKSRVVSGCVIRDWIAANTAPHGFWELIRQRYQAMQVTWECKNYEELAADDFQQAAYYMTKEAGYFVVLCFRGEIKKHYYDHVKRISSERNGIVLILSDRDLQVFMRQAMNGKPKEDHIQGIYDTTLRSIA